MPEYRAFSVGDDGHFVGFEPLVCGDDNEAIEKARRLAVTHAVELWNCERFVKRLEGTQSRDRAAVSHEIKDGRMVPKK